MINPYGMMFDEVTASDLVKIDLDGNIVMDSEWSVNPAGFCIHSAIHMAREDAKAVMHLIKEVYYDFRHLFCNEDSFGLRLQNHDSELATDVITTLLDNGVVCLPVHDSFIVKMQDRKLLEDTMAECFRERFGTTNLVPLGVSYKVDGLVEEAIILA